MGKPLDDATGEVDFSADICTYYAENAARFLAGKLISLRDGGGSTHVTTDGGVARERGRCRPS